MKCMNVFLNDAAQIPNIQYSPFEYQYTTVVLQYYVFLPVSDI